jgi:outer membrane protein TolC
MAFAIDGDSTAEKTVGIVLPPLDTLYAWADSLNPTIRFHDAVIKRSEEDARRVSKQWLDAIKLSGNLRVGSYGNTTINQVETGYTYGPSVSFSLYEILSHPNQLKIYKEEHRAAEYKRDEAKLDLHKYIRNIYNSILLQKTLLRIKSEALNTSYMHLKMAEKEFNEGAINLSELSRVNEIYTKSEIEYEMNVNELRNDLMELEQVVGVPLI